MDAGTKRPWRPCPLKDCIHHTIRDSWNGCNYLLDMQRVYGKGDSDMSAVQGMQCRRGCPPGRNCIRYEPVTAEAMADKKIQQRKAMTLPKTVRAPERRERWEISYDPEQLRALYNEGKNDYEIAQEMKMCRETVRDWRNGEGLPPIKQRKKNGPCYNPDRMRDFYDRGLSDREIAEEMQLSISTVVKWRRDKNVKPNKHETGSNPAGATPKTQKLVPAMLSMNKQGLSSLEISERLGVNIKTVRKYLKLNNREFNPRKKGENHEYTK